MPLLRSQQPRQLSNIHSDAPSFIEGQHLGDVSLLACLSRVDVHKRLARCVENLEAARYLLDLPPENFMAIMSTY